MLLIGPPGGGKTMLATALGLRAVHAATDRSDETRTIQSRRDAATDSGQCRDCRQDVAGQALFRRVGVAERVG